MKDDLAGSAASVLLHGGFILAFSWFSLGAAQKQPVVIDLSLLDEHPQQCLTRPADKPLPAKPQPKPEPRVLEPRPLVKALPEQAPPRPTEPQVQKVAVSENLVPVAATKAETPPSLPPVAASASAANQRSTGKAVAPPAQAEETGTPAEKARKRYLKEHFAFIRDSIVGKLNYPHVARKMGWCGTVRVSFVVCDDGFVNEIKILASSGFEVLDRNAVETIRKSSPFPKPPVMAEVIMPITYRLD